MVSYSYTAYSLALFHPSGCGRFGVIIEQTSSSWVMPHYGIQGGTITFRIRGEIDLSVLDTCKSVRLHYNLPQGIGEKGGFQSVHYYSCYCYLTCIRFSSCFSIYHSGQQVYIIWLSMGNAAYPVDVVCYDPVLDKICLCQRLSRNQEIGRCKHES